MEPIRVRLMNDYCAEWPLWDSEGGTSAEDWDLPSQLTERLVAWAAFFQEHFHEGSGFPSVEMSLRHRAEGRRLRDLLVEELGPRYTVTADLWEVDHVGSDICR